MRAASTLWLGEDHLLGVVSHGFSEEYKRFYFRDIQAIIIRKTDGGRIGNIILLALAVPALIAALVSSAGFNIFWFIVTGIFLLFVLLNTLGGPTCVCHLRTAVQTDSLPSLGRIRRARKVLARLRPLIAEAQGQLDPAEIPARMVQLASTSAIMAANAPPAETPPTGENLSPPPAGDSPSATMPQP